MASSCHPNKREGQKLAVVLCIEVNRRFDYLAHTVKAAIHFGMTGKSAMLQGIEWVGNYVW